MTREEREALLIQIANTGNDSEAREMIDRIHNDFLDYENRFNDYETRESEFINTIEEMDSKYKNLKKQYIDRFFGKRKEEIIEENKEDLEEESKPKSYDDLFEEREG
jgi:hypothetical protein